MIDVNLNPGRTLLFGMTPPADEAGEPGFGGFNIARVRDYWLGGCHHSEADIAAAQRVAVSAPQIPYLVRAQRALLRRMVRYLLDQGIRQFLDLGSGLPTSGHVHEIAESSDQVSRVVYVDFDPGIFDDSQILLAQHDNAVMLDLDIRDPDQVLDTVHSRSLLDLSEPVALLSIATLQHIPDSDDPAGITAAYLAALCSGSYLALSHYGHDQQLQISLLRYNQLRFGDPPTITFRDQTSLACFFTGLELVAPGIVPLVLWRPDPDDDLGTHPERNPILAGLGRKP